MMININLIVKNSFLTKTADAETRYKTQHTSHHVRKTLNVYWYRLVVLSFVQLYKPCIGGHFENKNNKLKKAGNIMLPLGVTYGNTPLKSRMWRMSITSVLVLNKIPLSI